MNEIQRFKDKNALYRQDEHADGSKAWSRNGEPISEREYNFQIERLQHMTPESAIYIQLLRGKTKLEDDIVFQGEAGPLLGPFSWYAQGCGYDAQLGQNEDVPDDYAEWQIGGSTMEGHIYYDGKWYESFEIVTEQSMKMAPTLFEESKAQLPDDAIELTALLRQARSPFSSSKEFEQLAKHESPLVRTAVASNRCTPTDVLYELTGDANASVVCAVINNPKTTESWYKQIYDNAYQYDREHYLEEDVPEGAQTRLARIETALAEQPYLPMSLIEEIARHTEDVSALMLLEKNLSRYDNELDPSVEAAWASIVSNPNSRGLKCIGKALKGAYGDAPQELAKTTIEDKINDMAERAENYGCLTPESYRRLKSAHLNAACMFTEMDWRYGVGDSGKPIYFESRAEARAIKDKNAREMALAYCDAVDEAVAQAPKIGGAAIEACVRGDWDEARMLAGSAYLVEKQFGDAPAWGQFKDVALAVIEEEKERAEKLSVKTIKPPPVTFDITPREVGYDIREAGYALILKEGNYTYRYQDSEGKNREVTGSAQECAKALSEAGYKVTSEKAQAQAQSRKAKV